MRVLIEVDIKASVKQHFADIAQDMGVHDVTYENGQARERTQVLMDIANQKGGMVIGTGDMSELALGWATYNGDHIHKYPHNNEPNGGQVFSELQHSRRTWTYDLRYTLPSQVPH